jgi:hypothetical protein
LDARFRVSGDFAPARHPLASGGGRDKGKTGLPGASQKIRAMALVQTVFSNGLSENQIGANKLTEAFEFAAEM